VRANLPGRGVALLATLAVLVVACSDAEPTPLQNVGGGWHVVPADAMSLGVSNGTTLAVLQRSRQVQASGSPWSSISLRHCRHRTMPAVWSLDPYHGEGFPPRSPAQKLRIRIVSP